MSKAILIECCHMRTQGAAPLRCHCGKVYESSNVEYRVPRTPNRIEEGSHGLWLFTTIVVFLLAVVLAVLA